MKSLFKPVLLTAASGILAFVALPAGIAVAQQGADEAVEEIVTIGTRREGRTAVDTAVPIDVFNLEDLDSVASDDLIDVIKTLVPSFNVGREPISDGGTFVRPPQLRGLDSDKTLVLVNGKRRHRAALVVLGGFGAHGPDLATIPSISLKSVEVLRDGASALYGSDAIAGVLNFNLKDASEGGELRVQTGQYSEGNESGYLVALNQGFNLTENGFINVSLELSDNEPTSRGQPYDISIGSSGLTPSQSALVSGTFDHDGNPATPDQQRFGPDALTEIFDPAGNLVSIHNGSDGIPDDTDTRYADNLEFAEVSHSSLTQIWGEPERDAIRAFINAGIELDGGSELYAWANYSDSNSNGSFFHRRPGVSQLSLLRTPDGNIYNPRNRYPAGFTPRFAGNVIDMSITGGIRGEFGNGMSYDFSGRFGENTIKYTLFNTENPSLGPATPTHFRPGDLVSDETAFNADFSIPIDVGFASDMNFAFGFEFRDEGYDVVQGDTASFTIGPYASPDPWNFNIDTVEAAAGANGGVAGCTLPGHVAGTNETAYDPDGVPLSGDEYIGCNALDPIFNAVPVGSNGFPGYGPNFTSSITRDSIAAYFDLEADITDAFLLTVAGRYEDFSDFGTNFSARVAARLQVNDALTLRASAGTGFRAPTPGQISTTNVSTRIDPNGQPVAEGIFPPTAPASAIFGATPLEDETSTQFTLGLAAQPTDAFTVTLDYYFIELEDRIVLSSDFAVGPVEVALLTAAGVPGANTIAQVSFFTNDVDTETSGIDIVASYDLESGAGSTTFAVAANFNDTEVTKRTNRADPGDPPSFFLNDETVFDEEEGLPEFRANLSARHTWENDVTASLRANWYGDYKNASNATLTSIQDFDGAILLDVDVTWDVNEQFSVTVGGNNITDEGPDPDTIGEACCGRIVRSDSVIDWQGPYYYVRGTLRWD